MIFPVRVAADAKPFLASDRVMTIVSGHPLSEPRHTCPVCDLMYAVGDKVVLVFCGIAPQDRKPSGYTTGGSVAVHAECAGVSDAV